MKMQHKARADIAALTDIDLADPATGMPVACPWCGYGWGPWGPESEPDEEGRVYRSRTFTADHGPACIYVAIRQAWNLPPRHPGEVRAR